MKASELMIGDLVIIDNKKYWPELKDIPLEVTGINQTTDTNGQNSNSISLKHINQNPNTYYEEYSQFIRYIKPIQLTEDWINKFGFYITKQTNVYYKNYGENGVEVILYEYHYKGAFEMQIGSGRYKSIQYVHQLQNLYFALTGKELTITA